MKTLKIILASLATLVGLVLFVMVFFVDGWNELKRKQDSAAKAREAKAAKQEERKAQDKFNELNKNTNGSETQDSKSEIKEGG